MPTPYSSEDFDRVFDPKTLRMAQGRVANGLVNVTLEGDTIFGVVTNIVGDEERTNLTPEKYEKKISIADRECSCGKRDCVHLAATAFAALAKFPEFRKPPPKTLIDRIIPAAERPFPPAPSRPRPTGRRAMPAMIATAPAEPEPGAVLLERPATPVLRLRRLHGPDEHGRQRLIDVLTLDFDYGGTLSDGDDERQFVRVDGPGGATFVRRNVEAEASALETLRQDGFIQMRVTDGKSARGRRVFVFRGPDAGERWHRFVAERVPALQALGWRSLIDADFGPRLVETVGHCDMQTSTMRRHAAASRWISASRSTACASRCCRS